MKSLKRTLILSTAFTFVSIIAIHTAAPTAANGSGAPSARTGSPGDVSNCTSCHSGSTATTVAGLITSDIPVTGYVPGTTYTITATVTSTGINKFGFEISPQNTTGVKKGTLVITDATQTQLITSGKYITHKTAGTAGTGTKTWTFNWIAPVAGTGSFSFYGAFVLANGNNSDSGDHVQLSSLAVTEDVSTGMTENTMAAADVTVYPNPAGEQITINAASLSKADVTILDLSGRLVKDITNYTFSGNQPIDISELPKGMYLLNINSEKGILTKKIVKE